MRNVDVVVLGAGIVGASTAHALLRRGKHVALIDRDTPGNATSYGNAGILESNSYLPISFPREASELLRYASNRAPEAHYHISHLPKSAPWLMALRGKSGEQAKQHFFAAMLPLLTRLVDAHYQLAAQTGTAELYRHTGVLRLYSSAKSFAGAGSQLAFADRAGTRYELLDNNGVRELEPHLTKVVHKGILWPESHTVSNPGRVSAAIAEHFSHNGGQLVQADARAVQHRDGKWQLDISEGPIIADQLVVALGPWSMEFLRELGYNFPLASVRGYHTHLGANGDASLSRPVVDMEKGFVLSPMQQGFRLTSAYEFAALDSPPTPVQIDRLLPEARQLIPLGDEIDSKRWVGARPCFPDTLPLIDRASNHPGLWFNFGHSYLGFSLGPLCGELLAARICDEQVPVDLSPFSAGRFG